MANAGASTMTSLHAGEAGGIIAGAVAAMAALGAAIRWAIGWRDSRQDLREAKLSAWEERLRQRDLAYQHQIEERLAHAERAAKEANERSIITQRRLRGIKRVTVELMIELDGHDPQSEALARAKSHLREAFPVENGLPDDLADLAKRFEEME